LLSTKALSLVCRGRERVNSTRTSPQQAGHVVIPGQEPPQLLEGDEFRIVPINHHALMIDPAISLQAHTPVEEANR
jgi:hypothetical protein